MADDEAPEADAEPDAEPDVEADAEPDAEPDVEADAEPNETAEVDETTNEEHLAVDYIFPLMTVNAAEVSGADGNSISSDSTSGGQDEDTEEAASDTVVSDEELPVTWVLDKEKSSNAEFSSDTVGEKYIYTATFGDEYEIDDECQIPEITIEIVEDTENVPFLQSTTIDGITVTVKADKGVFPADSTMKVKKIANKSQLLDMAQAAEQAGSTTDKDQNNSGETQYNDGFDSDNADGLYAFDITIYDADGKEVQPDETKGKVTVSFADPSSEKWDSEDVAVYHIDDETKAADELETSSGTDKNSVEAEASHFSPFLLRIALSNITLHTGCGTIADEGWEKSATAEYVSAGIQTSFPTTTVKDQATTFDGWYSDASYSNKVSAPSTNGTYYAKWVRTKTAVSGTYMNYSYLSDGMNATGNINGNGISTSWSDGGIKTAYIADDSSASGGGTQLAAATSGDIFVKAYGNLYVAQVATFDEKNVRYTYYMWNKGTSDISSFNLGGMSNVQIGDNDYAPLSCKSDGSGNYILMTDSGNQFRLYYGGSLVDPVDSLWLGSYSNHIYNVFNSNGAESLSNQDSTFAFSWKNISIPANSVVTRSVVLGCGEEDSFVLSHVLSLDEDANGTLEQKTLDENTAYVFPQAAYKAGYYFLGWNTRADGKGKMYHPGDSLYLTADTTLYIQLKKIENKCEVTLYNDNQLWTGQKVDLYQDGSFKYGLTENSGTGVYTSDKPVNGTYDIYVNGRKSDKNITFAATTDLVTETSTVYYNRIHINTRLDDSLSSIPGTVTLRTDGSVIYTVSGESGTYLQNVLSSEPSYDIYVDGADTGFNVSPTDTTQNIDFYDTKVTINDEAPWIDTSVELKKANGNIEACLYTMTVSGNSVTYSEILQKDESTALEVFIHGKDIHKSVKINSAEHTCEQDYFTATVSVQSDMSNLKVGLNNGSESYAATATSGTGTLEIQHIMEHVEGGKELPYTITVDNTHDEVKAKVSSSSKSANLLYHTVEFVNVDSIGTESTFQKIYVRDQNKTPKYTGADIVKLSGYTFNFWSETKWTAGQSNQNTSYDFSTPLTANKKLYANYTAPIVTIGDLIYTSSNGTVNGNGEYYRMGNLTISGFDPGSESIKYIFLTTSGTENINITDTSNMSLINGISSVSVNGGAVNFAPTGDKITITFTSPISMAAAQDFLRNKVIVKPTAGATHTMEVEVMDSAGKYVAINSVDTNTTSESFNATYSGSYGSTTLYNGKYYISGNSTFNNARESTQNGITIAENATVYIYIPKGVTLTAYGGDANQNIGAGAGIYVPESSTLYLLGNGTVYAYGGNAANGGDGGQGGTAYWTDAYGKLDPENGDYLNGGIGGTGGYGGGGAGAGIGGRGGNGGDGGTAKKGGCLYVFDWDDKVAQSNGKGVDGGNGNGGLSVSMGVVCKSSNIIINGSGGNGGNSGGGSGATGSNKRSGKKHDGKYWYGGYGGGGAGGGSGYSAPKIGSGGYGGAGGGAGGSGGVEFDEDTGKPYAQSAGGHGGFGNVSGADGKGERTKNSWNYGGRGGYSGTSGASGTSEQSTDISSSPVKYSVSFVTPTSTSTNASTQYYYFGNSDNTITFPQYTDTDDNVLFYGWQITTYAKSGVSGSELTTGSTQRHQPGTSVELDPSTYGDIVFTAITETIDGIKDDDDAANPIYNSSNPSKNYYTYNIDIQTDGETTPKGDITVGSVKVAPSADGTYTFYSLTNETQEITLAGKKIGSTAAFGFNSDTSNTTIEYETIKVTVTGKSLRSLVLDGENAPALSDNDDGTYSAERLKDTSDTTEYKIMADGEDTGLTAKYGANTDVRYHTVTLKIDTNIEYFQGHIVELVDKNDNNNRILLSDFDEVNNEYKLTRLENSTQYALYYEGEKTDYTASFTEDKTINVTFNKYWSAVFTKLDDKYTDIGSVYLGNNRLIRIYTGAYYLEQSENNSLQPLYINGSKVLESFVSGAPNGMATIDYYTITYALSGDENSSEKGTLPADDEKYLKGTNTYLLGSGSLTNGHKTFAGWSVNDVTYPSGTSITMNGKTTAKAVWEKTDINTTDVTVSDTSFVYNGTSQIPDITVTDGAETLVKGTDYAVTYTNSNTDADRNDPDGGTTNTINAGTVTIKITGINDYDSSLTKTYTIARKSLTADGLKAVDREYDGTCVVDLTSDEAVLTGAVESDDVALSVSSKGKTYSPFARENKVVIIGSAQLTGATASDYSLKPLDPVKVTINPKTLSESMFTVSGGNIYNGAAHKPSVSANDSQIVDGQSTNIINADDYYVRYSDNVSAGQGTIVVTAGQLNELSDGSEEENEVSNYKGSCTLHFTIEKAKLTIKATPAQSIYGEDIKDISDHYNLSDCTIFTEADKTNLGVKAVTSVKKGYNAGTYTGAVTISYNTANTDYDVTTVPADFTVTAAEQIPVKASGYTGIYDAQEHGITVTTDAYDNGDTYTVYYSSTEELTENNYLTKGVTTPTAFKDAGAYTVYYYVVPANDNYGPNSGSETVTIANAGLKVTALSHSITYGNNLSSMTDQSAFSGISVSGLKGSDTAADQLTGTVTYSSEDYTKTSDVGTYLIMPKGLTAKNYDISYSSGELTVTPRNLTFTWPDVTSLAYTGSSQQITATVSGTVNDDDVSVGAYEDETADKILNCATEVGTYTAKVKSLKDAKALNYTFDSNNSTVSQVWAITRAQNSWTINPSITGWTSGEKVNAPVGSSMFGEIVYTYADSENGQYSATVPTSAGTYYMKAEVAEADEYTGLTSAPVSFDIAQSGQQTKKTVYVNVVDKTITYGESFGGNNVNYTDSEGNTVNESDLNISGTLHFSTDYSMGNSIKGNVGNYIIMASGCTSGNSNLIYVQGTLTVAPKEVALSWPEDSFDYTGKDITITADITSDSLVNGDNITVSSYTGNVNTNVGTGYSAVATALTGTNSDNYVLPENASHKWSIVKADNAFTITPSIENWTYGESASVPKAASKFGTVQFKYKKKQSGILDWSIFNPQTDEVPTQAGTYVLVAYVPGDDNYKEITNAETDFTINPADVTIEAQDAESMYGQPLSSPLLYSCIPTNGNITDDDKKALNIKLVPQATSSSNVGSYDINLEYDNDSNINVNFKKGTYKITKAEMNVVFDDPDAVYDGKAHSLSAPSVKDADGKDISGAKVYYSESPLSDKTYGSGSVKSPFIIKNGSLTVYYYVTAENYKPVNESEKIDISAKEVTVKANDTEITYGDEAKAAGVICSGFVGSDSLESLNLTPSYSYTAKTAGENAYAVGSDAGEYSIIPSGLTADNYVFSYENGTMTVGRKALTAEMFTLSNDSFTYDGEEKEPAVAPSDLKGGVQLLVEDDYEKSFSNNIHAGVNTAAVTLTATDTGNYTGTVVKNFSIGKRSITVTAYDATSVYGNDLAELSYNITSGSLVSGDDLSFKAVTTVKKSYNEGEYEGAVSVSYDKTNTDYDVTVNTAKYTITPTVLTVSAHDYKGVYDGSSHTGKVTASTGKLLTKATIYYAKHTIDSAKDPDISTTMPDYTKVGEYDTYYYCVCENYEPVKGKISVEITKAPLTVRTKNTETVYGSTKEAVISSLSGTSGLTCTGFKGSDNITAADGSLVFTTDYSQYADAGSYNIMPSGLTFGNYDVTFAPGTLTVNKKPVSFTWPAEADRSFSYNGKEQGITATVTETARDTDDVSVGAYVSDASHNISNSESAAGQYTAKVSSLTGADSLNYTFDATSDDASSTWKIDKGQNSFLIEPSIADWTEGKDASVPFASARFGKVSFSYSTSENGKYTDSIPNDAAAGTYYLKAYVPGTTNYDELEQKISFTIKEPGQTENQVITITGSSKNIIYGDAFDTNDLTISDAKVTGLKDGQSISDCATGTIAFSSDYSKGSSAGNYSLMPKGLMAKDGYEIVFVPGTVKVSKKQISLAWSKDQFTYDGNTHAVYASVPASSLMEGDSLTVTGYEYDKQTGVMNSAVDAGSYTAHAISFAGVNYDNYTVESVSTTKAWTIAKAESGEDANEFTNQPFISGWTYGDTASAPEGTAKFGQVTYKYSDSESGSYVSEQPVNAGTWYMKAYVAGSTNYDGLESDPVKFTISPKAILITANDITGSKGAAQVKLTYTTSSSIVKGDDLGIALTTTYTTSSPAGDYPIKVAYKANDNYLITADDGIYHVANGPSLQITEAGYSGTYDGLSHTAQVTVRLPSGKIAQDAKIYYSETSLDYHNYGSGLSESPKRTSPGTTDVFYYVTADGYDDVPGRMTITISQKKLTITAKNDSIYYGDTTPADGEVTIKGFVNGDTKESLGLNPTLTYKYSQFGDCGTYYKAIVPVTLPANDNYAYVYLPGTLTVKPKEVSFTWTKDLFTYSGSTNTISASVLGTVNNDQVTVQYEKDSQNNITNSASAVGNYTAKVSSLSGTSAANYTFEGAASAEKTWTILKGANIFNVDPSIKDWTYLDTASEPEGQALYGTISYVYSTSEKGIYTSQKPSEAGKYYMKAIVPESAEYPILESKPIPFNIRKRDITISASSIVGKKDDAVKDLEYTISDSMVSAEDLNIDISTTAKDDSKAGEYPITITADAGDNYNVTIVNGTYTITNIDISASVNDYISSYDGKEHSIDVEVTPGDGVSYDVYYSKNQISTTEYATQSGVYKNDTSNVSYKTPNASGYKVYYLIVSDGTVILNGSRDVMISKTPLKITAKSEEIEWGNSAEYSVITNGFVNGENIESLTGNVTYVCDYKKGSNAGAYTVTPEGVSSANYDITFISGTLKVVKTVYIKKVYAATNLVYDKTEQDGYTGEPFVDDNEVTEFAYSYKTAAGTPLPGKPVDAGDYKVTISVPDTNPYYKGSTVLSFTIAQKDVVVKAIDQAIIAGQKINENYVTYTGFADGDNENDSMIETSPVVKTLNDVTYETAGEYTLIVSNAGTLTTDAEPNYNLVASTDNGRLVVITKAVNDGDNGGGIQISNDPDSGIVRTAVITNDADLPQVSLETNLTAGTAKALLTQEEQKKINDEGVNALIYLVLANTDSDSSIISKAAENSSIDIDHILFMDLSLFKKVGNDAPEQITETNGTSVTITVTLPDELINYDETMDRTYYVLCNHLGNISFIGATLNGNVLSYSADKFSKYAIAYSDKLKPTPGTGSSSNAGTGSGKEPGEEYEEHGEEEIEYPYIAKKASSAASASSAATASSADDGSTNSKKSGSSKGRGSSSNNASTGSSTSDTTKEQGGRTKTPADDKKPSTIKLIRTEDIGKEKRLQLEDALKAILKLDSAITGGPYYKVSDADLKTLKGSGNVTMMIDIPEELMKEGRIFYVMTVDKNGNVLILSNESIENGLITITGDPNATYQLIYEDGGAKLEGSVNAAGKVIGDDGNAITVSTNHCFWHYIILLIGILGAFLTLLFRKKKRHAIVVGVVTALLMVICMFLGWCHLDIIMTAISCVLMLATYSIITIVRVVSKFYRLRKARSDESAK